MPKPRMCLDCAVQIHAAQDGNRLGSGNLHPCATGGTVDCAGVLNYGGDCAELPQAFRTLYVNDRDQRGTLIYRNSCFGT